ncbi:sulfite exporter TauE/SafE family protein [Flavitalea flava]
MVESVWLLLGMGLAVGCLGTLIGAGGGFILVPLLIFMYPTLQPDSITAISMAIVACNAISGTFAYARAGRIDYKAGIQFAIFTIPGSILGVLATRYLPKYLFAIFFGILLIVMSFYLFLKKNPITKNGGSISEGGNCPTGDSPGKERKGFVEEGSGHSPVGKIQEVAITDKNGECYRYSYNRYLGWAISLVVGFISPVLGIGGGIIHVPALINWLRFPVHIATATSHFILAVMSVVSVIVHLLQGSYQDPLVQSLVLCLGLGAVAGAQLGAYFSHRIKGNAIEKALAFSLGLVGIRILFGQL